MRATYTRIYTDSEGISQFEDMGIELSPGFAVPPAEPLQVAPFFPADQSYWIGAPPNWQGEVAHPTPRRQIFVIVRGEVEVTPGKGSARRFPVGSVLILEDTTGAGHSSKITSGEDTLVFAVGLPPNDTA